MDKNILVIGIIVLVLVCMSSSLSAVGILTLVQDETNKKEDSELNARRDNSMSFNNETKTPSSNAVTNAPSPSPTTEPLETIPPDQGREALFREDVIKLQNTTQCLGTSGNEIVWSPCNQAGTWKYNGTQLIRSNKCLTANQLSKGKTLALTECQNNATNQTWGLKPSNNAIYSHQQPYLCLDASKGKTTTGTKPQLWDCIGNNNQKFETAVFQRKSAFG